MRITLTRGNVYALRALLFLASSSDNTPVRISRLAEILEIPPAYLSKIMHNLSHLGLLTSRRGPAGGFTLNATVKQFTLRRILTLIGGIDRFSQNPFGIESACLGADILLSRWDSAINKIQRDLLDQPLSVLAAHPTKRRRLHGTEAGIHRDRHRRKT